MRASLAFAVGQPPEFVDADGRRHRFFQARFLETDLPKASRITDAAIRGVFYRWRSQTKSKNGLI